MRRIQGWVIAGLVLGLHGSFARAEDGDCRAGHPQQVAWYAHPSETLQYTGYYVGGGSAFGGSCRCCTEGTWGWDYHGKFLPHRVILYWSGGRYQGGTGAYKPNGHPVPDVPALLNPAIYSHCR
jgi:hypothetical protein